MGLPTLPGRVWQWLDTGSCAAQQRRMVLCERLFTGLLVGVTLAFWMMLWVWNPYLSRGFRVWRERWRPTFWLETVTVAVAAVALTAAFRWWRGWSCAAWGPLAWVGTALTSVLLYWTSALRQEVSEGPPVSLEAFAAAAQDPSGSAGLSSRSVSRSASGSQGAPVPVDDSPSGIRDLCRSWETWTWFLALVPLTAAALAWFGSAIHWFRGYACRPQFRCAEWAAAVGSGPLWAVEALVLVALWTLVYVRLQARVHPLHWRRQGWLRWGQLVLTGLVTYLVMVGSHAPLCGGD